ncbi:MAG TPA: patatin-like phospholipase family protein [Roseiflexaceae bacterium]|nr:patatin-like phospholipase family protein [Roseiflexaceae bacterium]
MAIYRILTLDGGGIRGIFSARLLARLSAAVPGFLDTVDLFAGTSTGGILALGLAAGITPAELAELYRINGPNIFDDSWLDNLRDLGNLAGAQYDNRKLRRVLQRVFEQEHHVVMLDDLLPKKVLVPTFDLDDSDDPRRKAGKPRSWKPKFFHNYPGPDSDGQERIVDVAMRTSAAPTYFPAADGYIDGGVVVNNPAMSALAQAINDQTGGRSLADLRLFSLGTGYNPTFIAGRNLDWGFGQWARPLIGLMIDGVMGVADYQCRQLLGERQYHRLDCMLPTVIALDEYRKVGDLVRFADELDLGETIEWLQTSFAA